MFLEGGIHPCFCAQLQFLFLAKYYSVIEPDHILIITIQWLSLNHFAFDRLLGYFQFGAIANGARQGHSYYVSPEVPGPHYSRTNFQEWGSGSPCV